VIENMSGVARVENMPIDGRDRWDTEAGRGYRDTREGCSARQWAPAWKVGRS